MPRVIQPGLLRCSMLPAVQERPGHVGIIKELTEYPFSVFPHFIAIVWIGLSDSVIEYLDFMITQFPSTGLVLYPSTVCEIFKAQFQTPHFARSTGIQKVIRAVETF